MSTRFQRAQSLSAALREISDLYYGHTTTEIRELRRNAQIRLALINGIIESGGLDPENPMPPGDQVLVEEALTEAEGFVRQARNYVAN